MANFPLATWQVTAPAFTVANAIGSVSIPAATGKWGFGVVNLPPVTPNGAAADTIAYHLADAIGNAALPGPPPVSLGIGAASTYNVAPGTNPSTSPLTLTLATLSASAITLTFASLADAAVYGFASTTVSIGSSAQSTTATFNVGGVWSPCGVAGDLRRTTRQRAAASSSDMSGLTTDVVNWGEVADLEFLSSVFPAGNLTRWFAATQIYATAAGRNVADPNNTLEGLLQAAATGVTFRLYRQQAIAGGTTPTTYVEAKMPTISSKSAAEDYTSAVDEPRLWSTAGLILRGST
jgi:hypothetical protein